MGSFIFFHLLPISQLTSEITVCIILAMCSVYFLLYILCCFKEIQYVKWA